MTPTPVALIVDGGDLHSRAAILAPTAKQLTHSLRALLIEYKPSYAAVMLPIDRDGRYAELMGAAFNNGLAPCECGAARRYLDRVADVIAAVQKAGGRCVVVSGNRHLAQLVGLDVKLRLPFTDELFDPASVTTHFGVSPQQIPALFSLAGEKHSGIGLIPARNFLREHKTFEEICTSVGTASGKIAARLRANMELILEASRKIEIAKTRVPFPLEFIRVLGNLQHHHRLTDHDPHSKENEVNTSEDDQVQIVVNGDAFQIFADSMAAASNVSIFVDCNDVGLVQGVGISVADGGAWYVGAGQANAMATIAKTFADLSKVKIGYDIQGMLAKLSVEGVRLEGPFRDLKLLAHVIDASHRSSDLFELCRNRLGCRVQSRKPKRDTGRWAGRLAGLILKAYDSMEQSLFVGSELRRHYEEVECRLIPVLARMTAIGVKADAKLMSDPRNANVHRSDECKKKALLDIDTQDLMDLSVKPDLAIGAALCDDGSNSASTLSETGREIERDERALPSLFERTHTATEAMMFIGRHIDPISGRVYPKIHHGDGVTGRLSTSEPNLQGLPAYLRRHIVAETGCSIMALDYSQIDLRVLAHISGDEALCKAFHGYQDVHRATAADVFGIELQSVTDEQRSAAKAVNFGMVYGITAHGLAATIGGSEVDATKLIRTFLNRYPGVKKYQREAIRLARTRGYAETPTGRRRRIAYIRSCNDSKRAQAERQAMNTPIQGFSADIIKRAMVDIDYWLRNQAPEVKIILQIHDELVLEGPDSVVAQVVSDVANKMCSAVRLAVPLVVNYGIGHTWADAQDGKERAIS